MVPGDQERCFICGYEFAGGRLRWSWRTWAALVLLAIFLIPFIRLALRALE